MLRLRILTGVVLGVTVAALTLVGSTAVAAAVLGILWLIGSVEWTRLAGLRRRGAAGFVALHLAVMLSALLAGFGSPVTLLLWLALPSLLMTMLAIQRYPQVFGTAVVTAMGFGALIPSWLAFALLHRIEPGISLAAVIVVWGADVGAYAFGRAFGRHKLAPSVSPGKTWEGAFGGLLAAMAVAGVATLWLALPVVFVAVAAVAAAASIFGDLGVSLLKRHAGLKDSGRLLPGHGGALDRIDGLTTGLPIIAIGLQFARVLD